MKGYTVALLCFFAVAQALEGDASSRAFAVQGENPWFVHLRTAVSTSGLLDSAAGSFINERWVLTSASAVLQARFVWVRFGAIDVVYPSLVIETSTVRQHNQYSAWSGANNIALVSLGRAVESTANYSPINIALPTAAVPQIAKFCGFGATEHGAPGERLSCYDVPVTDNMFLIVPGEDGTVITEHDGGAPLVSDNVQYGLLINSEGRSFLKVSQYRNWIETTAAITLNREEVAETVDNQVEIDQVKFVN